MSISENIKKARIKAGYSQTEMAEILGIKPRTYGSYERGERDVNTSFLKTFCKVLQISSSEILDTAPDNAPGIIDISAHKHRKYNIVGAVACGDAIVADDHETFEFDDIGADFALRCKGDSMINARIYDGDLVFIRECELEDIRNGEIAAVRIDHYGDCTLKKVFYDNARHRVTLMPCNPDYEPIILEGKDLDKEEFKVLGKAVAFVANL